MHFPAPEVARTSADGPSAGADDPRINWLLTLACEQLGIPVAFLGRFEGPDREIRALSSAVPLPVSAGFREPREDSHCQRVVDATMPNVVADVAATP